MKNGLFSLCSKIITFFLLFNKDRKKLIQFANNMQDNAKQRKKMLKIQKLISLANNLVFKGPSQNLKLGPTENLEEHPRKVCEYKASYKHNLVELVLPHIVSLGDKTHVIWFKSELCLIIL